MRKIILFPVIILNILSAGHPYFQQHVSYDIQVSLDDSAHTLTGQEILVYTNNSPDTLDFIWFHLWPNAYKHTETAFARQMLARGSTRFHFSRPRERGYIDSLDFSIKGQSLELEYHPEWSDAARVRLPHPLLPGDSVTIHTPFFVKLPKVFSRLGHTGKHYEITQWYPKPAVYDRQGWHPMPYLNMGEFYSEFGTFDVHITLPAEYRVMATGDLVHGEAEYAWLDSLAQAGEELHALDKKAFKKRIKELNKASQKSKKRKSDPEQKPPLKMKTLHFHQENVHDFAWFADRNWIVRKDTLWLADSTRRVTLWSMYLPKNAELWENSLEYIHDAGYWYSRFFGDYPYNHITAVDGDLSAGGGMEYPNITVIASIGKIKHLLEFIIMHEVGHNWFYGIYGNNERDHAWLDEGLNEYANIRYWEQKYGEQGGVFTFSDFLQHRLGIGNQADMNWLLHYFPYTLRAVPGDDQPIDIPSVDFEPANYGVVVYYKTALFMDFLDHYLGDETITAIFSDYFTSWSFQHPQPDDFRAVVERHTDADLDWFFDGVIKDTRVIDYGVEHDDGQVQVTNFGTLEAPLELVYYDLAGREIERRWIPGFSGWQRVAAPAGTHTVKIDPEEHMPDVNRTNNTTRRRLRCHLIFEKPDYAYDEWYLAPALNWNAYDGSTPGLFLYTGFLPGYRHGFYIQPRWDFRHDRPVGSIFVKRNYYGLLKFHTLNLSARLKSGEGVRSSKFMFTGLIKKPVVNTPRFTFSGTVHYLDLNSSAVTPELYQGGRFLVSEWSLRYSRYVNPFWSYNTRLVLTTGTVDAAFAKSHGEAGLNWRMARDWSLRVRLWAGSFLTEQQVPKQYRTYLGGGVDPNFDAWVASRIDDGGRSFYNLYEEQFIWDGPGLRGRSDTLLTARKAWSVNLDQSLPRVPCKLFLDWVGTPADQYMDAGLLFTAGPLQLIVPVYQSWDAVSTPPLNRNGLNWLSNRLRFVLKLSDIRISF